MKEVNYRRLEKKGGFSIFKAHANGIKTAHLLDESLQRDNGTIGLIFRLVVL